MGVRLKSSSWVLVQKAPLEVPPCRQQRHRAGCQSGVISCLQYGMSRMACWAKLRSRQQLAGTSTALQHKFIDSQMFVAAST